MTLNNLPTNACHERGDHRDVVDVGPQLQPEEVPFDLNVKKIKLKIIALIFLIKT